MSQNLLTLLDQACRDVFAQMGFPPDIAMVRESDRPDIAPFQCNGAMAASGIAKKRGDKVNPRDIAARAQAALEPYDCIAKVEIAGPGFLNIHPSQSAINARAQALSDDPKAGISPVEKKMIIVDYGGANVAKPMHVGHLRSAVIGESIKRLLRAQGHDVIGDVHMGDWGLQMGHLISELAEAQPELPYFDESFTGDYPDMSPVTMDDLARLYPQASNKAQFDPERMEASRVATAQLQAGRRGYRALLEHFIAVSVAALKTGYGNLGVEFDLWKGEACVDPLIPDMIADLKAQGIAEDDDGALIIRVEEEADKKQIPPVMLLARSGAVLYHTTDMATLVDRKSEQNPDLIVYVVDQRQALHFEQIFRAAIKAGWYSLEQLIHVGFGTMNGKDGTPFKTREGGVLRLEDLVAIMYQASENRLTESGFGAEFDAAERQDIAHKIGLAALKFADLQNQRLTNYVFDPERFTAFEGKTGPYLLYAAVRIKSILRKAESQHVATGQIIGAGDINAIDAAEQQLIFALDSFDKAVRLAAEKFAPHVICDHIYRLAQSFSRFYTDCPIMVEEVAADVQSSRLALAKLTLKQLTLGLDILGIEAPERM